MKVLPHRVDPWLGSRLPSEIYALFKLEGGASITLLVLGSGAYVAGADAAAHSPREYPDAGMGLLIPGMLAVGLGAVLGIAAVSLLAPNRYRWIGHVLLLLGVLRLFV